MIDVDVPQTWLLRRFHGSAWFGQRVIRGVLLKNQAFLKRQQETRHDKVRDGWLAAIDLILKAMDDGCTAKARPSWFSKSVWTIWIYWER